MNDLADECVHGGGVFRSVGLSLHGCAVRLRIDDVDRLAGDLANDLANDLAGLAA